MQSCVIEVVWTGGSVQPGKVGRQQLFSAVWLMMKGAMPDSSNPSLIHLPSTPAAYTIGNQVNSIQKGLAEQQKVDKTNKETASATKNKNNLHRFFFFTKSSMKQINPD